MIYDFICELIFKKKFSREIAKMKFCLKEFIYSWEFYFFCEIAFLWIRMFFAQEKVFWSLFWNCKNEICWKIIFSWNYKSCTLRLFLICLTVYPCNIFFVFSMFNIHMFSNCFCHPAWFKRSYFCFPISMTLFSLVALLDLANYQWLRVCHHFYHCYIRLRHFSLELPNRVLLS